MTAAEIAAALGGTCRSGSWHRCICPVHGSRTGRSPTLALRDGERGLVGHCHAGCSRDLILAELHHRGLIGRDARRFASFADDCNDHDRRIEIARRIWRATRDASGTPVMHYLASRAILLPIPHSLRYAPSLRRPDGEDGPAMVARIDGPGGELIGISRTWLRHGPDGTWQRRDRAMLGRAGGGAVRLAPAGETLMISEGIETGMAAMAAMAVPAWAALSAGGIEALALSPMIREIIILADHDLNGRGERAARLAGQRWVREGRRVRIAAPPEAGTDFADILAGSAHTPVETLADAAR